MTHAVQTELTAVSLSGLDLTSAAFSVSINATYDATHFLGGYVEVSQGGTVSTRGISDHNNGSGIITLTLPLPDLKVGDTVTAYPGCDHDNSTCSGKFANIDNYGGFPFIPEKNPMDGTSVF